MTAGSCSQLPLVASSSVLVPLLVADGNAMQWQQKSFRLGSTHLWDLLQGLLRLLVDLCRLTKMFQNSYLQSCFQATHPSQSTADQERRAHLLHGCQPARPGPPRKCLA